MKTFFFSLILALSVTALSAGERYMYVHSDAGTDTFLIAAVDSLTFENIWQCGDTLIDVRDGQKYATVQIGSQCWMAENLNVGTYKASINTGSNHSDVSDNGIIEKYAYDNDTTNFAVYGGLYDWDEAMGYTTTESSRGICPEGWHIPSDGEWKTLEIQIGMDSTTAEGTSWRGTDEGTKIKDGGSAGFNALLSGFRSIAGTMHNLGVTEIYWTSTVYNTDYGWYRQVDNSHSTIDRGSSTIQTYGFCIRCVRD